MAGSISPWPLVKQGDQQHPVQTLQYLLRARGHAVTVDGIFGPATDGAVRSFQQQRGLSVDGAPRTYTLRATQVYRREGGEWKVAHRHADPLST